jgi:hypothetical protein
VARGYLKAVSWFQASFFQYAIVGPVYTPEPTTAVFRTLRAVATCTPSWLSGVSKAFITVRHLSKNALPKIVIAWVPAPRPIATGRRHYCVQLIVRLQQCRVYLRIEMAGKSDKAASPGFLRRLGRSIAPPDLSVDEPFLLSPG